MLAGLTGSNNVFTRSNPLSIGERSATWWVASESGWGGTLLHVDDLLVAIWYPYDDDGEAVFVLLTTTRPPDGSFAGEILRQKDGNPFSAIQDMEPNPGADVIGTATLRFIDGENADLRHVLGSIDQTRRIHRLLVGSEANVCRSENAAPR